MNHKLAMGCAAGLATLSLTAGGSTYAAFSDFQNLNGNSAGATFLRLELGKDGAGVAALSYNSMKPGSVNIRTIWLSSHDGPSPAANLSMTVGELVDKPASCSIALSKALAESASGVVGCAIRSGGATGTPAQGNLSRVLTVASDYLSAPTTADACAQVQQSQTLPAERTPILPGARGSLAAANGTTLDVNSSGATALVLRPGDGACVAITASWQASSAHTGTPDTPVDAAAQGDSLTFQLRFDLTQV